MRDRITGLKRVRASELVPHPENYRLHPTRQAKGINAALGRIGFADALICRELGDGKLQIVDGHLRAEVSGDELVPVLVTDLSESEAREVLATMDPLVGMAAIDEEKLQTLLESMEVEDDPEFQALLAEVDEALLDHDDGPGQKAGRDDADDPDTHTLVVTCGPGQKAEIMTAVRAAIADFDGATVAYS